MSAKTFWFLSALTSIYETMVRLAKGNESLLHPFVDSKGNFGKVYSRDMAIRDPEIIMPQIRKCVKTYFPAGYQLTEADMQEYQELFNFVTLSLDKNGEYVGCAHRHPPQQILTISASGSSWGFAPTAASAGDWRAVLHVQAVVVGTVDYHLRIYGMERGEQDAEIPSL